MKITQNNKHFKGNNMTDSFDSSQDQQTEILIEIAKLLTEISKSQEVISKQLRTLNTQLDEVIVKNRQAPNPNPYYTWPYTNITNSPNPEYTWTSAPTLTTSYCRNTENDNERNSFDYYSYSDNLKKLEPTGKVPR